MASASGLTPARTITLADPVPPAGAALRLFQPFTAQPMHLAKKGERAHHDKEKEDDL
ncbi:hypothetical protein [uncultured Sulfitobacter sp.]|uniref:hypothetical protein n=1 Tax=uncultured Sulfitobacter sp. TaxID=191468 RepID=UPI0026148A7E|nr:hypothetical protein [uncultured Sulfitobacter sp.]